MIIGSGDLLGAMNMKTSSILLNGSRALRTQLPVSFVSLQPFLQKMNNDEIIYEMTSYHERMIIVCLVDLVELTSHPRVEDTLTPKKYIFDFDNLKS